jgi:hypothetical protein
MRRVASTRTFDVVGGFFAVGEGGACCADLGQRPPINVQKVLWCCGELDIRYQRVDAGGPFGGNRDPSPCG